MCAFDPKRAKSYLDYNGEINAVEGKGIHSFEDAFRDTIRMFNDLGIKFALFGAHAVAAYVSDHRATHDVDVVTSRENISTILRHASHYGFDRITEDDKAPIQSFQHRSGIPLDIIFDARGFADLEQVRMLPFGNMGLVPVASPVDIAFSKLRTQSTDWQRKPEKRASDLADLIQLIRENPQLADQLMDRLGPIKPTEFAETGNEKTRLRAILRDVCSEAMVSISEKVMSTPATFITTLITVLVLIMLLLALLIWLSTII